MQKGKLRLVAKDGKVDSSTESLRRSGPRPALRSPEQEKLHTKLMTIKERLKQVEDLIREVSKLDN